MVCLGNICRSPTAAAVLDNKAKHVGASIEVGSAGTADYHVGEGPNPMAQLVWTRAGYTYTHIARHFTASMFDTYDYILVMDRSNYANVARLARTDAERAKVAYLRSFDPALTHVNPDKDADQLVVPDPWGGPQSGFEEVLAMIESAVDGMLEHIA